MEKANGNSEEMSQWPVNRRCSILPEIRKIQMKTQQDAVLLLSDWGENLEA